MMQRKIDEYVELLADNMALMGNYAHFVNSSKKMLLVEGTTDEKFVRKMINDDVWCITAVDAFSNEDFLMPPGKRQSQNNKLAIIGVTYGLSKYPTLINSKGLEKWNVYGMIDMDFDEPTNHTDTPKLFITDTHDLETLLLSTDDSLMDRIDRCTIADEDIQKSYFIAYQLGIIRVLIHDVCSEVSLKLLSAGEKEINYSEFIANDLRLNISKLMSFLYNGNKSFYSVQKWKKVVENVLHAKTVKKKFNAAGSWKQSIEDFDLKKIPDFWNMVNGHDILALLRYLNDDAKRVYSNSRGRSLNREFEMDLIESYDYNNVRLTKLYSKMRKENVVKDIS